MLTFIARSKTTGFALQGSSPFYHTELITSHSQGQENNLRILVGVERLCLGAGDREPPPHLTALTNYGEVGMWQIEVDSNKVLENNDKSKYKLCKYKYESNINTIKINIIKYIY